MRTDLLILDDWGLSALTEAQSRDVLEVLEDRSSQLSVTWFQQITTFFHFSCFLTY